jgi:hypothetical protein
MPIRCEESACRRLRGYGLFYCSGMCRCGVVVRLVDVDQRALDGDGKS